MLPMWRNIGSISSSIFPTEDMLPMWRNIPECTYGYKRFIETSVTLVICRPQSEWFISKAKLFTLCFVSANGVTELTLCQILMSVTDLELGRGKGKIILTRSSLIISSVHWDFRCLLAISGPHVGSCRLLCILQFSRRDFDQIVKKLIAVLPLQHCVLGC
jgi:hypothetical protein